MKPYVVLEKAVGQTPLQLAEVFRATSELSDDVPLAYAGRLDPMASGKLLVLIGEECKRQEMYHGLDKEYVFEVLLGTSSDTGDVLGLLEWQHTKTYTPAQITAQARKLTGDITLPYPHYSSKTVQGKPLHTWALEKRLAEIEIPTASTHVYKLECTNLRTETAESIYKIALEKINSLPEVTEESKKLGADFRRKDVRIAWQVWLEHHKGQQLQIATMRCIASSGTYMRSLAGELGKYLGSSGLAYSIHRTTIGTYKKLPFGFGFWSNQYK